MYFSERLSELIFERGQNCKTFAREVNISESCISGYIHGILPSVKHIVMIADYFNCSTDFLLGREEYNSETNFSQCPDFSKQIKIISNEINPRKLFDADGISKSRYYDWKSGKRQPSLDSIIKIADSFELRVDHILGREN